MRATKGFTLIELTVALVVLALLAAVTVPSMQKFSSSMRYHDAVRHLVLSAREAKRKARVTGKPVDLLIDTDRKRYLLSVDAGITDLEHGATPLPSELNLEVTYAREVSPANGIAAIRFYPEGGATGGEISLQRPSGSGVRLVVDWLMAGVAQEALSDD